MMKKKKKPGVFFSNPSDKGVSKEASNTIKTFVEGENDPVGTHNLSEDYARIIDVEYGQDRKPKKMKRH